MSGFGYLILLLAGAAVVGPKLLHLRLFTQISLIIRLILCFAACIHTCIHRIVRGRAEGGGIGSA